MPCKSYRKQFYYFSFYLIVPCFGSLFVIMYFLVGRLTAHPALTLPGLPPQKWKDWQGGQSYMSQNGLCPGSQLLHLHKPFCDVLLWHSYQYCHWKEWQRQLYISYNKISLLQQDGSGLVCIAEAVLLDMISMINQPRYGDTGVYSLHACPSAQSTVVVLSFGNLEQHTGYPYRIVLQ